MKAPTTTNQPKTSATQQQLAAFASYLRAQRLEQSKSLMRTAKNLGISTEQLQALETWQEEGLPPEALRVGLLNKYARLLGTESIKPRMYQKRPVITLKHAPSHIFILSRWLVGGMLGVIMLVVLVYLTAVSRDLIAHPRLNITWPVGDQTVTTRQVRIEGSVGPETIVQVNGEAVSVDEHAHFASDIQLRHGQNDVTITAINNLGRRSTVTRYLYY